MHFKELIDKNQSTAWIPCDGDNISVNEYQTNTNRYHWHKAADELGITHKTLDLWSHISICGNHGKTLSYRNCGCGDCGKYGFVCSESDECYRDDKLVSSKVRTVVLFNKEGSDIIKNMTNQQIKDYLIKEKIIEIKDGKYYIKEFI